MGVSYGVFMWLAMSGIPVLWEYWHTSELDVTRLIAGGIIWLVAGAAFGLIMYVFLARKGRRNSG
jgi:hypothetical protein